MLPEGLCNALCSLNANEPKLTFTSWFRIRRSTGEVILDLEDANGPRFAKTVIQSCCRFTYEEVQDILDGVEIPLTKRPTVFGSHNSWDTLVKDVFLLYDICGKVRGNRFENGSVRIDKSKMRFRLNEDDVPTSYEYESHTPSHWMIEELMLLSNEVVAKKICDVGETAVLRRHPPPQEKSFTELSAKIREQLGVPEWDGSTSKGLFNSLQLVRKKLGPKMGSLIEYSVMKTMRPAQYCIQGSGDFHHYALSFDYYTHFTSPIRRYPDVLVHRQLQTVLEMDACGLKFGQVMPSEQEVKTVEDQCNLCNVMKKKSREAQEACDVSFFCIYLRNRHEFNITTGTVLSVTEKCMNVYVPKINKDVPIFFMLHSKAPEWFLAGTPQRLELDAIMAGPSSIAYASESLALVQWTPSSDRMRVNMFDQVKVVIVPLETVPISFAVRLLPPSNSRYAEKEAPLPSH
jgi:VacB/RNase II family 3'-5' exoribonuclease